MPRTALQRHRACYFLWGIILAWGGTSSDLGGTAPECPSVASGPLRLQRYSKKLIAKIWLPFNKTQLLNPFSPPYFLVKFKTCLKAYIFRLNFLSNLAKSVPPGFATKYSDAKAWVCKATFISVNAIALTCHFNHQPTILLKVYNHYRQYLNCRRNAGGRVPPSTFSGPPLRLRRPSIKIWALDNETIKSQPIRINPTNSGRI